KTAKRATVQLIVAYFAQDLALVASHAASIEAEGELTSAFLLEFPVHLLHGIHPGRAFRCQGGKFDHYWLRQTRRWLEEHAAQQYEQQAHEHACPLPVIRLCLCSPHTVSSLHKKSSSMRRSSSAARCLATALSRACSGKSASEASQTCCRR